MALLERLCDLVWGLPMMGLILVTGILFTVRLRAVQLRGLGSGLRYAFCGDAAGAGEVTPFAALCTALAATIGTGNIVGVATAICAGGPGALFWMLLAAILGMVPLMTSIFWGPMAVAIAGGLLGATVLTLLVLPTMYAAWFRIYPE